MAAGIGEKRDIEVEKRAGLAALRTANPALLRYYLAPVVASLCYEYFDQAPNDESGNSYLKNDHDDP